MNEIIKKTWLFFFLILFSNSVFAAGYYPDRLNFAESTSSNGIVFDRGNGCMTKELSEKEVNALWKEILIKGFSADALGSNQPANNKRETLDNNKAIFADADAKAGDLSIKAEVPSQKINPLEVPMLLGKSCTGSFDYGINLKDTLRVGRCNDLDNSACYVADNGLYRQNDMTGFFKEAKVVGKDLLVGIKETLTIDGNTEGKPKEDMGVFSDMSSLELQKIQELMQSNDTNALDTETWDMLSDKIVPNKSLTQNFAVTMQTTCRGENCYINTYSLFDKMFNQYFSVDMVYSSATPFLFNGAAKIFNVPGVKNFVQKVTLVDVMKKKGLIKPGGFMDTLTKDPALFVRDPFGRINKALKASKYARSNVDDFIEKNLAHTEILKRDIDKYDIRDFTDQMLDSTQKSAGETRKFNADMIVKDSLKDPAKRRAAADVAQIYADKYYSASALLKSKMANKTTADAVGKYTTGIAAGRNADDILRAMTKAEYDAFEDYVYTASRLAKTLDDASYAKFAWKDGFYNSDVLTKRSTTVKFTDDLGNVKDVDLDLIRYKSATGGLKVDSLSVLKDGKPTDPFGKELKLFEFEKVTDPKTKIDALTIKGASKSIVTTNHTITLADGTTVTRQRLKTMIHQVDKSNIVDLGSDVINAEKFAGNTKAYISYIDNSIVGTPKYVEDLITNVDFGKLGTVNPKNIRIYPNGAKDIPIDDFIVDQRTGLKLKDALIPNSNPPQRYGEGYFDLDPAELASPILSGGPDISSTIKKIDDTANRFSDVLTTMSHKEWVSGRGRDALNQFMKNYNGPAYQRFIVYNPLVFGINFAYWEVKTGGATLFGDTLGFTKYSVYQLPESYSALKIKHKETGKIYDDSYVDFFANTGSDQGDLFMQFMNSMMFWSVNVTKEVVSEIGADWSDSVHDTMRSVTEGQIKRSKTDDIVLITNNITSGCNNQSCLFVIGPEYVEQNTKNASIMEEPKKEETPVVDEKDKAAVDFVKEKESKVATPKVDFTQISIKSTTPEHITTSNYILENTSEKNQKVGQTIITFSHHTDYDGTVSNQSTEKAVDLVQAKEKEETCTQKLTNLNLFGVPIGKAIPESFRNHRFITGAIVAQKLAYMVYPGAGYFSAFLAPALISDIPLMFVVMPQIHGCVDDQEGIYAHFFVSAQETDRLAKDSKNKVGEAIKEGTKKVEETVSQITSGTDLEKGVAFGSDQVQKYVDKQIIEDPIVQATYTTGGGTNTSVKGQLFFFELGPKTKCMASGYNDKGVEILNDKDTNTDLIIDREKGILSVSDENGTRTVIGENNKDFVRLIGDNLGIPAKVVPRSLSYIPVPNNAETLFEIDSYGNLSVINTEFFDCLRAGYEAQTGLKMNSSAKNLTAYLGKVKLTNDINPNGAYTTTYLGNKIIADGAALPTKIATGNTSKAKILGNRTTRLGPINGKDETIGINVSVQFDFGQLVYSEDSKAYILWVETTTETHGNDIASMKTEVVKTKATNGCDEEELGFKFITSPVKNDDQAKANTDKLNTALEKVGPFQMFDTKTKTFIFYVSDPPECEQRLKIIDKVTGEVTDSKITSFDKTPNGIVVKTDDGKTHNLEFSAEDGVPRLTYNGDKETLMSAQGKNGAFWYDPDTGNWYTTNGNLIPLNDAFRNGASFVAGADGKVTGTPGTNVFNIGSGGSGKSGGGFNIPITPESTIMVVLYIAVIMSGFVLIYLDRRKIRK